MQGVIHVTKECGNNTMNSYKQQVDSIKRKKPDKNVVPKRHGKDGSTNTTHIKLDKE